MIEYIDNLIYLHKDIKTAIISFIFRYYGKI